MSQRCKMMVALAILGVWLGAGPADAGALALTASVDRTTVAIHQPLTLTITLSGELPRLDAPPDFDMPQPFVVAARSQSTNVSIGGGTVARSVSFVYVLVSSQAGTYQLGPFHLDMQGHAMETEALSIIVNKPVLPPGAGQHPRVTL